MKQNKLLRTGIFALVILLITSLSVAAFGVTAPYWSGNNLNLIPGETREVIFTLQNMVGDEDLTLSMEVSSDKQYVRLLDDSTTYEVPAKTKGVPVRFEVIIPEDAVRGSLIPIKLYFATSVEGTSGQLALGTGITKGFDVFVAGASSPVADKPPVFEKPQEESVSILSNKEIVAAIIVILLVAIVWIFLKRSRRNQRGNKRGAMYLPQQNKHDQW